MPSLKSISSSPLSMLLYEGYNHHHQIFIYSKYQDDMSASCVQAACYCYSSMLS